MFCWDKDITFHWNQKNYSMYQQKLSIVFEVQDNNRNFIKYVSKDVLLQESSNMIDLPAKMSILTSTNTQTIIHDTIATAKLEYANYILA
jgi:hypothetical protein